MRLLPPCSLLCLALSLTPAIAQENSTKSTVLKRPSTIASSSSLPTRGLSKESVEQHFGAPTSRHKSIGTPPISRWVYPGYVVYFEYNHVIQAVASQNRAILLQTD